MKGILFKPDMIQAIIEGRKTQTRRLGELKEINQEPGKWILVRRDQMIGIPTNVFIFHNKEDREDDGESIQKFIKHRYQVGKTVYVKEAWKVGVEYDALSPSGLWNHPPVTYKVNPPFLLNGKWRSPLFIPEWAARYFITITDVRAERLQEITIHGISKEGIQQDTSIPNWHLSMREKFIELWNSTNKDYPWESNPWVFVYTFK